MAVVMSNFGGPSGGFEAGGQSAVWSDKGELVSKLEGAGTGLVIGTKKGNEWKGKAIQIA